MKEKIEKIKELFKSDQNNQYDQNFKISNLIIQISAGVSMFLSSLMFIFGIVGMVVGSLVENTTNIHLNLAAGISLFVLGNYIFLICLVILVLSVISSYYQTGFLKVTIIILSFMSVVCMVGAIYMLFTKNNQTVEQEIVDDQVDEINEAKKIEKLKQVEKTYKLVKNQEISEDKLTAIFKKDPEFEELYYKVKEKAENRLKEKD
ncbi:hypothetical protein [Mycoplasma yeatsii]|uniref:Glucan phosphoethanolaminetransferase (Alkaline phosphatase superfamily) n=1 Tax=Mycoplasma yeatsii TaxID=51365 RepID=A0ABU0NEV3_9MOLU|nr:hypothetical protein [Mycoplasma yeatsii]MDQ0567930.1 glucan phosphoethanolaminetransferase (alkaline phosphatase superfamily) [Mycoplasma yeatsii]